MKSKAAGSKASTKRGSKSRSTERSVLEMTAKQARAFFLKAESYFRLDIPPYFEFGRVLRPVAQHLGSNPVVSLPARQHEAVNHKIYSNKDGRYAWRPFQLIHPAIYVGMVNLVTDPSAWEEIQARFSVFADDPKIQCLSIPQESLTKRRDQAAQVHHWWEGIEQKSLDLALDYSLVFHADITDCYASVYTHSISWALHGKAEAKAKRRDESLLGNRLDWRVQDMQHGQTNGIPQGSVLLDLVAEIVLGFADLQLSNRLKEEKLDDFRILRYRDDYRVFVNDSRTGEQILKLLTEVLLGLGLKLNASKTTGGQAVVESALKIDKLQWMRSRQWDRNVQKHLLLIHSHAADYPNAGSVLVGLDEFCRRIGPLRSLSGLEQLISITVDIAFSNPRCVAVCAAILSKFLSLLSSKKQKLVAIGRIRRKLLRLPNTGHLELWLQRICHGYDASLGYSEPLCALVQGKKVDLWNGDWITDHALRATIDSGKIVNKRRLKRMRPVIPPFEFRLFSRY